MTVAPRFTARGTGPGLQALSGAPLSFRDLQRAHHPNFPVAVGGPDVPRVASHGVPFRDDVGAQGKAFIRGRRYG